MSPPLEDLLHSIFSIVPGVEADSPPTPDVCTLAMSEDSESLREALSLACARQWKDAYVASGDEHDLTNARSILLHLTQRSPSAETRSRAWRLWEDTMTPRPIEVVQVLENTLSRNWNVLDLPCLEPDPPALPDSCTAAMTESHPALREAMIEACVPELESQGYEMNHPAAYGYRQDLLLFLAANGSNPALRAEAFSRYFGTFDADRFENISQLAESSPYPDVREHASALLPILEARLRHQEEVISRMGWTFREIRNYSDLSEHPTVRGILEFLDII